MKITRSCWPPASSPAWTSGPWSSRGFIPPARCRRRPGWRWCRSRRRPGPNTGWASTTFTSSPATTRVRSTPWRWCNWRRRSVTFISLRRPPARRGAGCNGAAIMPVAAGVARAAAAGRMRFQFQALATAGAGGADPRRRAEGRAAVEVRQSRLLRRRRPALYVLKNADGFVERGIASWYGPDFHGKRTSSGEIYDMYQMTAAHKTLPIPTYVQVTNLQTGRSTVVKVNDRGPFKDNRIIDLSYVAARKLGIWEQGTGLVEIRALTPGGKPVAAPAVAPPTSTVIAQARATGAPVPFYIQIGAFIDRGNAERLRARVLAVASNVQIAPGESNGQAVYRVQIGPFTDVDASDRIVHALLQAGVAEYRIVLE